MRVVITEWDYANANKAKNPTHRQKLRQDAFKAAGRPFTWEGDIDRDTLGDDVFDMPDVVELVAVVLENDGRVWLRVAFSNCVDLQLDELRLPHQVRNRIIATMEQLRPPKRSKNTAKKGPKTPCQP